MHVGREYSEGVSRPCRPFGQDRLPWQGLYNFRMRRIEAGLPGGDLIQAGLADLRAGVESVPALLVAIGAPRLVRLGIAVPHPPPRPEHQLYLLLAAADPDRAHSRYNALVRRLVSFERALACAG